MEDASGVDLDWFWRGWFYGIDNVDISLKNVRVLRPSTYNSAYELSYQQKLDENDAEYITTQRNKTAIAQTLMEAKPELKDEYNDRQPYKPTPEMLKRDTAQLKPLSKEDKALIAEQYFYYEIEFANVGGLIMPIILEIAYEDGTKEVKRIPVEVWRMNTETIKKVFPTKKAIKEIILDPFLETADTDRNNNYFPPRREPTRFELFRQP